VRNALTSSSTPAQIRDTSDLGTKVSGRPVPAAGGKQVSHLVTPFPAPFALRQKACADQTRCEPLEPRRNPTTSPPR
jgi:hypothetical protein